MPSRRKRSERITVRIARNGAGRISFNVYRRTMRKMSFPSYSRLSTRTLCSGASAADFS